MILNFGFGLCLMVLATVVNGDRDRSIDHIHLENVT
jgi:hypothetical protein